MVCGPAKILNPHISVLYMFCEVKFKFKCLQLNYVNFGMIDFMRRPSETCFGLEYLIAAKCLKSEQIPYQLLLGRGVQDVNIRRMNWLWSARALAQHRHFLPLVVLRLLSMYLASAVRMNPVFVRVMWWFDKHVLLVCAHVCQSSYNRSSPHHQYDVMKCSNFKV